MAPITSVSIPHCDCLWVRIRNMRQDSRCSPGLKTRILETRREWQHRQRLWYVWVEQFRIDVRGIIQDRLERLMVLVLGYVGETQIKTK